VNPIPVDEGGFLRWNADPFDLDGGSGTSETDPGALRYVFYDMSGLCCGGAASHPFPASFDVAGYFLLAYWMARCVQE
jgi:hypothetical protein